MTKKFFKSNNIVLLKADKSNPAPEVDELLKELGNTSAAIPYFGLFQPGEEPIHFDGVYLTPESFLDQLGADKFLNSRSQSEKALLNLPAATAN
jgi:thiol:disulfide interchange protein